MSKFSKVKERVSELQGEIDAAETRETDAIHELREALTRLEKAEAELATHDRRIKLLQAELNASTTRYDDSAGKLNKVEGDTSGIEDRRKELEDNEVEGDERLQDLEERAKEARRMLEENEVKLTEIKRKEVVLKRDIIRVVEKGETSEKRVNLLENTIQSTGENLRNLEEREDEASEKEALNEDKIAFLECQMKEAEVRLEAADRQVQNLERVILDTENEKNGWVSKRKVIEDEMENIDGVDWLE